MKVYFDNAATTPLCQEAIDSMTELMQEHYGNPSSPHSHGRKVRGVIETARKSIANNLGCSSSEITFTSGGTEADNMVLQCAVKEGIQNIITSKTEHKAILNTAADIVQKGVAKVHFVQLDSNGHIDLENLEYLLKNNPKALVSLMHANNEVGNMIDLEKVGSLCKHYDALFHSDTVQTVGHYPIDLGTGNIDFISASAHKFNGPKGIGFLFIRKGTNFCPMILGGGQETNLRGGTENVMGIVSMAKALETNTNKMQENMANIQALKSYFIEQLDQNFKGITFNGDYKGKSNYKVLNVSFPNNENASMMLFNLDIRGISCSGGSACSSGASTPSHVLAAMNTGMDRTNVRFSFGKQNTKEEIDYTIGQLKELFPELVLEKQYA